MARHRILGATWPAHFWLLVMVLDRRLVRFALLFIIAVVDFSVVGFSVVNFSVVVTTSRLQAVVLLVRAKVCAYGTCFLPMYQLNLSIVFADRAELHKSN